MKPNNRAIYEEHWSAWLDMKVHGPASRWLRFLIHSQMTSNADLVAIESILDVGCGEGTTTHFLAKMAPDAQVLGVDFSNAGIQCARSRYSRPNLNFLHDESLRHLDDKFDLVSAFEVLEHVEEWQDLLERISRSARRFIWLSFPTGRMRAFEKQLGHYRNFKPGEVESFLSRRGFTTVVSFYAGFPFFSPLYRDFCNITYKVSDSFTRGAYGTGKILMSNVIYWLFRFCSTKHRFGDQFCGVFFRT
jgi:SAM-dependent methyltransferase